MVNWESTALQQGLLCLYMWPRYATLDSTSHLSMLKNHVPVNILIPNLAYIILVLQTNLIFLSVSFVQLLGLDGPYLALLSPLLASSSTPSTCGNPVSTRPKPIFDQKHFREFWKLYFGFLRPKLASYGLETIIERYTSKFPIQFCVCHLCATSGSDFMFILVPNFRVSS